MSKAELIIFPPTASLPVFPILVNKTTTSQLFTWDTWVWFFPISLTKPGKFHLLCIWTYVYSYFPGLEATVLTGVPAHGDTSPGLDTAVGVF